MHAYIYILGVISLTIETDQWTENPKDMVLEEHTTSMTRRMNRPRPDRWLGHS